MNPPITIVLSGCFSVRLYDDSRPNYLETAPLQKGLVLVYNGQEIIEEGMGFGAPVVLFRDRALFSSSATTSFCEIGDIKILTKRFVMDSISRKKIKGVFLNDRIYRSFQKHFFHKIYTEKKNLAPLLTKLIELMKRFGVNTEFQKIAPRGAITIKYSCFSDSIEIEVLFSELKKGYSEIAILNEQGASTFRRYSDSNGLTLLDSQIGAWEMVEARVASFSKINGAISFSLFSNVNSKLLRGREKIKGRYSWVGFCYSLGQHIPKFKYSINLETTKSSHPMNIPFKKSIHSPKPITTEKNKPATIRAAVFLFSGIIPVNKIHTGNSPEMYLGRETKAPNIKSPK